VKSFDGQIFDTEIGIQKLGQASSHFTSGLAGKSDS
jgi:hypothetical protein